MSKVNNFGLFLISKQYKCKQVFTLKEEFEWWAGLTLVAHMLKGFIL